ncbi:unnamed protein product [Ostreobium quekettii]|uniref:Uncharacterized protein n=1 Tax=Ostreobium quekettii TaxID=121088 RepID=A0A8S1JA24_9CHLO|nr:unnamed protein product [Ostreobium quekettii]
MHGVPLGAPCSHRAKPSGRDRPPTALQIRCDARTRGGDSGRPGRPVGQPGPPGAAPLGSSLGATPAGVAPAREAEGRSGSRLPEKADLVVVRTDGLSCQRETVNGALTSFCGFLQNQAIGWKNPLA